jgi:hypothetical protein
VAFLGAFLADCLDGVLAILNAEWGDVMRGEQESE